jgi:hypothetical protein
MASDSDHIISVEDAGEYPCHQEEDTVLLFSHRSGPIIGRTTMNEIKQVQSCKSRLALLYSNGFISLSLWLINTLIAAAIQLPGFLAGIALISFVFAPNETVAFFQAAAAIPAAQLSAGMLPIIGTALIFTTGLSIFTGNGPDFLKNRFSAAAVLQRKLKLPVEPVLAIKADDFKGGDERQMFVI